MKKTKVAIAVSLMMALFLLPAQGFAYTIDQTYNKMRSSIPTSNNTIVLHETGTYAPAVNNAIYFDRVWSTSFTYTSFIVGDGGKVYQVSPTGYLQWGAGTVANQGSPAQIELARTTDPAVFAKDYPVYVNLARDMAKQYGIPLTLDSESSRGIKSHLWFTQRYWGDHTDPFDYLASMGVSKAKLAQDLQTGLPESGNSNTNTGSGNTGSNSNQNTSAGYKVESLNVQQTVDVNDLNVRAAQNTGSAVVGQLAKGQAFNATRVSNNGEGVTLNGKTYYSWFEVNGAGWVSGAYVTPVSNSKPDTSVGTGWVAENGTFTANTIINVRDAASTSGKVVAQYSAGQSVKYDSYKVSEGYVWIHYTSYSGQDRYMAVRVAGQAAWGSFR